MLRLFSFIELKKAAYSLADERDFLKKHIKIYNLELNLIERYISESIIRDTWDFHAKHGTNLTDGQETRLIMLNCIYAGMFAASNSEKDADELLSILENNGITRIDKYVERFLKFDARESFVTAVVARGLVQDVYNNNIYLYPNHQTPEGGWEYYKDVACVMFELGALYYENR